MAVEIRRASARFTTREPGRLTRHALSFGEHYDPDRLRIGPMVCLDDHVLGAGRGFADHPHRDLEIVSCVVEGALHHVDDLGTDHRLPAGAVSLLSAGAGVEHAERATTDGPCRFVQVWLVPDRPGGTPAYAALAPGEGAVTPGGPGSGRLVAAGAGVPGADAAGVLPLGTAGAALRLVHLAAGEVADIGPAAGPDGSVRHVLVASGALLRSGLAEPLASGDAFVLDLAAAVQTGAPLQVTAAVPSLLLVWTFG